MTGSQAGFVGGGRRVARVIGMPFRLAALGLVRAYRVTLGQAVGGRCGIYPSCSAYAGGGLA